MPGSLQAQIVFVRDVISFTDIRTGGMALDNALEADFFEELRLSTRTFLWYLKGEQICAKAPEGDVEFSPMSLVTYMKTGKLRESINNADRILEQQGFDFHQVYDISCASNAIPKTYEQQRLRVKIKGAVGL
jgi:hypothetical protein